MRLYTVHQSPDPAGEGDLVFVKDGFCWPALFLPLLWPLYRMMWLVFFLVVLATLALGVLVQFGLLSPPAANLIEIGLLILFALEANGLRRWTLARRGWREIAAVSGASLGDAERRFFGTVEVTPTGAVLPREAAA